jgi:hypothetical protein
MNIEIKSPSSAKLIEDKTTVIHLSTKQNSESTNKGLKKNDLLLASVIQEKFLQKLMGL